MEGDTCIISLKTGAVNISIHALRVEGDRKPVFTGLKLHEFLSTPSGWRATKGGGWLGWVRFDFYPRPPGGGRLDQIARASFRERVYIKEEL